MTRVVAIVEGHGEVAAVPLLLRRIGEAQEPPVYPDVPMPIRVPKARFVRDPAEQARALRLAASKAGPGGSVLVLLDADEDCPAELAPRLLASARETVGTPVAVVLAKREYEAWFLAAAESIAGRRGLALGLTAPVDPEAVGGAKAWLTDRMANSRAYRETRDQPALTEIFDLGLAKRRSASFDKLWRDVERLLAEGAAP